MTKDKIISVFLFTLISCNNSRTIDPGSHETVANSPIFLDKIIGTWTEIEYKDNNWIIYQPCDADIFRIDIRKENGKNLLNIGWGQEQEYAFINSILLNPDSSLTITSKDTSNSYMIVLTFKNDVSKSEWQIKYPERDIEHNKCLVKDIDTSLYKKIIQPCKECWDWCDSLGRKTTDPKNR